MNRKKMRVAQYVAMGGILTTLSAMPGLNARSQDSPEKKPGDLRWKPYTLRAGNETAEGELGRLVVPENRRKPTGRTIELAFVRLKSLAPNPGPPLIYLDGGPGSSAISLAQFPEYFHVFAKLREVSDVILLDQRGVGMSNPRLVWASPEPLPLDILATEETFYRPLVERCRKAADFWRGKGVDLHAYNTEESADDVNDLRRALGAEKVHILGFSYGTHLGLSVIRRHGEHLASAVLIGTEGPNHTLKLPSNYTKHIRHLSRLIAADPTVGTQVPDFAALMKRVLDRLEKQPVKVQIRDRRAAGKTLELLVGKFGLQKLLMMDIGDGNDIPIFPALLMTLDRGDTSLLAGFVEKRYYQFGMGIPAMTFVMDCASGVTKDRLARINREAKTCLLGNAMNAPFPEIGEAWGNPDLGDAFRGPIHTNVRTLFVSGTLDSNTLPTQADEVRATFTRSTHLVVPNAGHEDMLVNPQVQATLVDFYRGKEVNEVRIALPAPKFLPIPAPE